jgi:hypothetical protein
MILIIYGQVHLISRLSSSITKKYGVGGGILFYNFYPTHPPPPWKKKNQKTSDDKFVFINKWQGSKLTFQPASQAGLIDCNLYQSAEKLFSPPHIWKFED